MISINDYIFKNFIDLASNEKSMVLLWRNHNSIRKWMFNSEIIEIEGHNKFIESLKEDNSKRYWLVSKGSEPIGVSSVIGIENNKAEWGYYLSPSYHESFLAVEFYYYAICCLFDFNELEIIYGYEIINNRSASSLNTLFGFSIEKTTKIVNKAPLAVNYRELTKSNWVKIVKNDPKILRLLNFSTTRPIE